MGDDSHSEDYLAAVTVGGLRPINGTVDLYPYDPQWPRLYARFEREIRSALGERALLLEHVGSTSVPGLAAKPVIDIVLEVADSADEDTYVPALIAAGYTLRIREPEWFEHRMFKCPNEAGNLHVFSQGSSETQRMLRFRDWLRACDEDRQLYERTKRDLAARSWKHMQDYADAKTAVVKEIMERAEEA